MEHIFVQFQVTTKDLLAMDNNGVLWLWNSKQHKWYPVVDADQALTLGFEVV